MQLLLHIGTEKTGTTTFQKWFSENRQALKHQGIWYAKSLGIPNHRKISICARGADRPDDGFWQMGITNPEQYRQFYAQVKKDFDREVEEALKQKCRYFIISNEHLHSRMTSDRMVHQVKDFIGTRFQSIQIIVHLRPQVDVAVSLASTASRVGKKVNRAFFEKIDPNGHYFNYNFLISLWESVFTTKDILIIPFKKSPCITNFFIEKLGIKTNHLADINRENEAVDVRTMALVNVLNIPKFDRNNKLNRNREIFIDALPKNEKLAIGIDLAKSVQAKFNDSNAEVVNKRQEIEFEDLQPDWKKYDIPSNIDILDYQCPFSEQLNALVQHYNAELKIERARTRLAESERAIARQNFSNANIFLKQALQFLRDAEQVIDVNAKAQDLMNKINIIEKTLNSTHEEESRNKMPLSDSVKNSISNIRLSNQKQRDSCQWKTINLDNVEQNIERVRCQVQKYKQNLRQLH